MSESTPDTTPKPDSADVGARHLQPVREESPAPAAAQSGPVRQSGGHMTGLLALLLAVTVFAFLSQFSNNQQLQAQNAELTATLADTQAELAATQKQVEGARDAFGGLKDVLARIETLLAPPVAAGGTAATDESAEGAAASE